MAAAPKTLRLLASLRSHQAEISNLWHQKSKLWSSRLLQKQPGLGSSLSQLSLISQRRSNEVISKSGIQRNLEMLLDPRTPKIRWEFDWWFRNRPRRARLKPNLYLTRDSIFSISQIHQLLMLVNGVDALI